MRLRVKKYASAEFSSSMKLPHRRFAVQSLYCYISVTKGFPPATNYPKQASPGRSRSRCLNVVSGKTQLHAKSRPRFHDFRRDNWEGGKFLSPYSKRISAVKRGRSGRATLSIDREKFAAVISPRRFLLLGNTTATMVCYKVILRAEIDGIDDAAFNSVR